MRRYLQNIVAHYGLTHKQHTSIDYDLIEARINEYFSKAHSFYLNGVKDNHLDYNFYHNIFFVLLEKAEDSGCIKNDFESKFAYYIVKHALTEKVGLVRKFFENNPIGSYCGLLKLVLGDKYIDKAHNEDEVHEGTNSSAPTDMHNQTYQECVDSLQKQNIGQGLLLQSSVPDKVYSLIAHFVNNLRLFDSWISAEDVKGPKGDCPWRADAAA